MKAAQARALTLGATVAWAIPVGLAGYLAVRGIDGQGWSQFAGFLPELLTPGCAWSRGG